MVAVPSHANGVRIQYFRIHSGGLGRLQLVNLDCKHQTGGNVPRMTECGGYARGAIKDSLMGGLMCITMDLLFFLFIFY